MRETQPTYHVAGLGWSRSGWLPFEPAFDEWQPQLVRGAAVAAVDGARDRGRGRGGSGTFVLWRGRARARRRASERSAASAALEAAVDALGGDRDPRRAVIAAYGAMQRTLGEHGVGRSPAEAPREYLHRVLVASRATEREARTLTELFEEARYSTHPIPERVRDTALSALRSLQGRLHAEAAQ